ncbi:dolichyl-P-Man:Man7GlcNAc2-PP-dolichol alpha-1,6-mannosyltransferase [Malassezia cuniculi]|uniref:Mannosyltransferase n=1 Tax=Malassezia cuniculi TaxID=948313 RepID=A0AAF0JCK8_9BASI|nr:dolichyl-P-Man:Man7GlcNAc2-PP-dolichol alpha-1,6-mannosyltransferase [Malassezia cuniculi]
MSYFLVPCLGLFVIGVVQTSAHTQVLVRGVLAAAAWTSLVHFSRRALPKSARTPFLFLCAAQFHLAFWLSRTTPNGLAFPLVTAALGEILGGIAPIGLATLTITALVFRLELVALAGAAYLYVWLGKRVHFAKVFAVGVLSVVTAAALTMSVDTYFWAPAENMPLGPIYKGLVWPELSAVVFNVVDGHSSEWGISPPLHYWTHEIPKLLSFSLPLLFVGILHKKSAVPTLLAVTHVALLSLVKHKEWRFIMYAVPLFNAASAIGAASLSRRALLRFIVLMCIAASAFSSLVFLWISAHNYPGGVALDAFHRRIKTGGRVHISVPAAMTGVSRFQCTHMERPSNALVRSLAPVIEYDKTERPNAAFWDTITWTISDGPCVGKFKQLGDPIDGLVGVVYCTSLYA